MAVPGPIKWKMNNASLHKIKALDKTSPAPFNIGYAEFAGKNKSYRRKRAQVEKLKGGNQTTLGRRKGFIQPR